ncbi:MAG: Formate hydrogenlyase subunit 3 [Candidatus Saccharicenans subterraneus]|uniref:Formate hydrogenlyase subunit 3 n=1 Tax=Candidatus Saccharicenans subterraneus TaxID=2508984 RepID=A0A3E2BQG3_9BACT|nr:MAG: Formate hydrogenlyase subunit 3 [Candidatus Saccharicenans subterraneum]
MTGTEALWLSLASLLLSFLAAFLLGKKVRLVRLTGTILISLACFFLAWQGVMILGAGQPVELELKLAGIHIPVLIDGLSALFLLLLSVLALGSTLFAYGYYETTETKIVQKVYLALPVFIAGLVGLLTVDDLGPGFTLAWQLMAISSYLLIRWGRPLKLSGRPALVYLVFMEMAWVLITGSAFLAKGYHFGDSLAAVGQKLSGSGPVATAIFLVMLLLGFGLKTGIFPLGQLWIPGAYSTASPPVSALLAGILEKTGVFGLIRIFFFVARGAGAGFNPDLWGQVLVVVGTLTLFVGTVQAIKQSDYLRLLAYSSIGQVGYIVLALGSSLLAWHSGSPLAGIIFAGAVYHSLNHGIFKSLLFLTGGSLLYATGTRDLNRLGGLLAVMPVTGLLAALASYSISGMPASSGFVSKWLMIAGNFLAGKDSLLLTMAGIVALFTAAFTLACYVKFFGLAFTSAGAGWKLKREIREVPGSLLVPKIFLAAICLSQAFLPAVYVRLIGRSLATTEGFLLTGVGAEGLKTNPIGLQIFEGPALLAAVAPLAMLALLLVLAFLARWLRQSAGAQEARVPAWLCGYQDLNKNNVYADRNMFSDLKKFFRWTGANKNVVIDDDELSESVGREEKGVIS